VTWPGGQPTNVAAAGSDVGVQAQYAYIDTVTIPGNVQLTVGQDASPPAKYRAGVENLRSGNPLKARELIWDAMMSNYVNSEVLFHWLVAMISGRTVQQFSEREIDQLRRSQSRYAKAGGDAWADGARLIYRLLDPVLEEGRETTQTDMSLVVKQFDSLGDKQRDMVRPPLELFLSGRLRDEMWRQELQLAQSRQHADDRPGRAWMFFQPIPAEVLLPSPLREDITATDRLAKRASAWLFTVIAGYLGWELLWHGAFLGLLSFVAALASGAVAARADLERRFLTRRLRQKDEQFRVTNESTPSPPVNELAAGVDKLFDRYFKRYAPDRAERERWAAAAAGLRTFHRNEIIAMCWRNGISANEVAWLIRYDVRELKQRWQDQALYDYRMQLLPRPGTGSAYWAGLVGLIGGGVWTLAALRGHLLADVASLLSAFCAWRCWQRVSLERKRYAADSQEHAQRQAAIDMEFSRWHGKLEARPEDAEMAAWLASDRTVMLATALDYFHLTRSKLIAHAFLEEPGVAVKRARIEGGPWRHAKYRLRVFLLAEDGVRHVRANLDFMKGTLTERERTSYRYESIVSVRVVREARRQTFELRLTAGEPITIQVREPDLPDTQDDMDKDTGPTVEQPQAAEEAEDFASDMSSAAELMRVLEGVAGEGRNWFRGRNWAEAWSGDNENGRGGDVE
jgi:hypothetical protein